MNNRVNVAMGIGRYANFDCPGAVDGNNGKAASILLVEFLSRTEGVSRELVVL